VYAAVKTLEAVDEDPSSLLSRHPGQSPSQIINMDDMETGFPDDLGTPQPHRPFLQLGSLCVGQLALNRHDMPANLVLPAFQVMPLQLFFDAVDVSQGSLLLLVHRCWVVNTSGRWSLIHGKRTITKSAVSQSWSQ
jgi:hypothetical protein